LLRSAEPSWRTVDSFFAGGIVIHCSRTDPGPTGYDLHRPVDLVTRLAVEESPNPNRRKEILGSARLVYDA